MAKNKQMWSGGPGKSYRKGITLAELTRMFPNEEAATGWFESVTRPTERCCGVHRQAADVP